MEHPQLSCVPAEPSIPEVDFLFPSFFHAIPLTPPRRGDKIGVAIWMDLSIMGVGQLNERSSGRGVIPHWRYSPRPGAISVS